MIWDKKAKDKDIALTKAELELLKAGVERLDKQGRIAQNLLDLCLKIKNEKSTS